MKINNPWQSWIIILFILLFYVVLLLFSNFLISSDEDGFLSKKDIFKYSKVYIRQYNNLVERNIKGKFREDFSFYQKEPYCIKGIISTIHGASIEFIPLQDKKVIKRLTNTNERIERAIFKARNFNLRGVPSSKGMSLIYGPMPVEPLVSVLDGQNIRFLELTFKTEGRYFLNIADSGEFQLENGIVDNATFRNLLIIKGSNRKKFWTKKVSEEEASKSFVADLRGAYFKSEEFREYLATPELAKICRKILKKDQEGKYLSNDGYWNSKADFQDLRLFAKKYGLDTQFTDQLYNFMEKQSKRPGWFERHPVWDRILVAILTLFLSIFLPKTWHFIKQKIMSSDE